MTRSPWLCLALAFAAPAFAQLSVSPPSLDFGGQSMGTTSPALTVTVTNNGSSAATVASITHADSQFGVTHGCATIAPAASCTVHVTFSPAATPGDLNATAAVTDQLSIASDAPGSPNGLSLAGTAERSLVTHFYRSILRRAPDAGGKLFWTRESYRLRDLAANPNEIWYAMAAYFFASAEYAGFNRTDGQFVTDMYGTFFNRAPDQQGFDFWTGQLASGLPREVALASFMFSAEFASFSQAIFGPGSSRPEVDVVMDFYRGMLARLSEDDGLTQWAESFRAVQCGLNSVSAMRAQANAVADVFASEHAGRNRSNAQYVGDLYNAILRRGGDLQGVQYWVNQLDTSAMTRAAVRYEFMSSTEFGTRLQAMVDRGCISHGTASTFAQTGNPNRRRQSIEVGAGGFPAIAYWDTSSSHDQRFVQCGNDSCTAGNADTLVLHSSGGSNLIAPALAIPGDGLPVMVSGNAQIQKCGNASCSAGNQVTVVRTSVPVERLDVGPGNLPVLAFTRQEPLGAQSVVALACSNAACSSAAGDLQVPLFNGGAGVGVVAGDVRFASDATPAFAAISGATLQFVKCGNAGCSAGKTVRTLATNAANAAPAMRMGADGFPTIAYSAIDANGGPVVQVVKCSDAGCVSTPTVSTVIAYNHAHNLALAIPADGRPVLVMEPEAGSHQARVVKCGNPACSAGNTGTTLGGFGNRVSAPAATIGSAGLPVLVFVDGSDRVRVLACTNAACTSN